MPRLAKKESAAITVSGDLKRQLIAQLFAWVSRSRLTQQQAAGALGIDRSNVRRLERYTVGMLMDLWEKVGGAVQITLVRPELRGEPDHKPSCKRWNGRDGWKESQPCTCGALV
jgi:predicted XRE-type DNA-binding protein